MVPRGNFQPVPPNRKMLSNWCDFWKMFEQNIRTVELFQWVNWHVTWFKKKRLCLEKLVTVKVKYLVVFRIYRDAKLESTLNFSLWWKNGWLVHWRNTQSYQQHWNWSQRRMGYLWQMSTDEYVRRALIKSETVWNRWLQWCLI